MGQAIDKARVTANVTIDKEHMKNMARVEIYTKDFCGYCARAKALLNAKGVTYEEYDISLGGPKRIEMLERAKGRATVPQIFIDGQHVGGSDDLSALESAGRLNAMLGI